MTEEFHPFGFTNDELVSYMDQKMLNYAKVVTQMLFEATDLIEERTIGSTIHIHCDEDSGGTHRLDVEGWEETAEKFLERVEQTFKEEYRAHRN